MASSAPQKFTGWVGKDKDASKGKMVWEKFEPKKWEETDVDIEITHCGICGSDIHTLQSGWGPTDYPCVVGHEIVGKAIRVGSQVQGIKVGDRVGVGAISNACFCKDGKDSCSACAVGQDQWCEVAHTDTYNGRYPSGDKSYGGYATHSRVPGKWVFKIPDGIASEDAAVMLCAGITTYRPLKLNNVGPGKTVGVIGIGGLGHFGLLWAKAMGADEVVAISRSHRKDKDALALGADRVIATSEDKDWDKKNTRTLDVIISTVSGTDMPLNEYLSLLKVNGRFVILGAPEGPLPELWAFKFVFSGVGIQGSMVGSVEETKDMLEFAAKHKVKPWVTVRPMSEANKAVVEFEEGKPRYRYVLKAGE